MEQTQPLPPLPPIPEALKDKPVVFGYIITNAHCEHYLSRHPNHVCEKHLRDCPERLIERVGAEHNLYGLSAPVIDGEQWCFVYADRRTSVLYDIRKCKIRRWKPMEEDIGIREDDHPQWYEWVPIPRARQDDALSKQIRGEESIIHAQ